MSELCREEATPDEWPYIWVCAKPKGHPGDVHTTKSGKSWDSQGPVEPREER